MKVIACPINEYSIRAERFALYCIVRMFPSGILPYSVIMIGLATPHLMWL